MVEPRRLRQLRARLLDLIRLPDARPVIALSGGADSAALADLISQDGRGRRAIHVNHGLAASERLEQAARAVADHTDTPLEVLEIEVPPGASFEGQARDKRYEALVGALQPDEILLTAHTLDDQAETVLMNLFRGSGAVGLGGIPARSGRVARPMLQVSRSQTRELSALAGLPYQDDPSNLDPALRRNAIRLEVLPSLAARFNPRLVEALARSASLIQEDESFLESQAAKVPVLQKDSGLALPIGSLLAVPGPVADRAIRGCLATLRPPYAGTSSEMAAIWEVVRRRRAAVTVAGGLEIAHDGPVLTFRSSDPSDGAPAPVGLEVGRNQVGGFEILVDHVEGVCRVFPIGSWSAVFPDDVALEASVDAGGRLMVTADREPAWLPGERRLPVAWYRPGANGYLSVFAREESEWT